MNKTCLQANLENVTFFTDITDIFFSYFFSILVNENSFSEINSPLPQWKIIVH
jgi:hypothetical protein